MPDGFPSFQRRRTDDDGNDRAVARDGDRRTSYRADGGGDACARSVGNLPRPHDRAGRNGHHGADRGGADACSGSKRNRGSSRNGSYRNGGSCGSERASRDTSPGSD